ncbi:hypothetical protein SBI_01862 [Streptomyces bingchenggensis BCW-1]|uniref:Secreted protein n=1 Tax=Streptomyces bingchenggensis (strain BCW-1) TaxID=749414 RepID=D7BPX6_STRBB|nr:MULTISPECIES: hypothetical protein [Streptomyces]ADI04983.1 hypothetical protein SBI_01862 [Streptomyces bingchenggensis BCW-1]
MRRTTPGLRATATAAACAALLAGAVALAPTASAVSPDTATAPYNCGTFGTVELTLHAAQNGTRATITPGSPDLTAPVAIPANTISATLLFEKNGGPGTTKFTNTSSPAIPAGFPIQVTLVGTVAPGDSLDSYLGGGSLRMSIGAVVITCNALAKQTPGPFVFD